MFKIKSWPKLIFSIIIAQSAGFVGTFFTISSIPTWYTTLVRPVFAPPNWVFGPVWTILYTLIGISLYLIWIKNKKGSLKLFWFHLLLNALWSPIFFGLKNLGLAFVVILVMDVTLVFVIKNFYKINKIAAYILIPYLIWIGFATLLNFSFWQLNLKNTFAQEFTFNKAREDFVFTEDNYKNDLFDFNLKKASYQKNPTLSIKDQLRVSTYKFVISRNELIKNYLTMLRIKTLESTGIENSTKESIYTKLDPEVVWYEGRKNNYSMANTLEDLINKSKEEDSRFERDTTPIIYLSLAHISLGEVESLKQEHIKLYNSLEKESEELIKLGRADAGLFDRWFRDIDKELNSITDIEKGTLTEIEKILGDDEYKRDKGYENAIETLEPVKSNLLRLNGFIKELENVLESKR